MVIGTSLKVQPFSGLITKVQNHVPRVLINLEIAGEQVAKIGSFFGMEKGFDFKGPDNVRDVALLGELQQTLKDLVYEIGWEKEFAEFQEGIMSQLTSDSASKPSKKNKEKKEKKK